jgi:hypothetical protein
MEPGAVARLLGLMDPNEAVVLLAALGDGNARLASQALSSEERDRMVQVGPWSVSAAAAAAVGSAVWCCTQRDVAWSCCCATY